MFLGDWQRRPCHRKEPAIPPSFAPLLFRLDVLCFGLKCPLGRSFVTEGNGHVIDPAGEARRALQAVVAAHGTQALSNPVIMDEICRERLGGLPGEAILIGTAARSDVPVLLRERIGREGTYGAIQSVAATLAQAHALDLAACLWVVREFARALGFVASGGTQPTARAGSGPVSGAGGLTDRDDAMPPGGAAPPGGPAGGVPAGGVPPGGAAPPGGSAGGGPGGGVPGGGVPAAGPVPGRSPGGWVPSRNVLGIAAAIALVAVYLGVAAAAHVSPFLAKTVASSTSQSQGNVGNSSPVGSPDPAPDPDPDPDPTPPSPFDTLLNMIPSNVQGTSNNCSNDGTAFGATAVADCTGLQGLAATAIIYYLFSDTSALSKGFSAFLTKSDFPASAQSCTTNNQFSDFITNCRNTYTSTSPATSGSIAEYIDKDNDPVIVSTDNKQLVLAVLFGTYDENLLAYWQPLQWIYS